MKIHTIISKLISRTVYETNRIEQKCKYRMRKAFKYDILSHYKIKLFGDYTDKEQILKCFSPAIINPNFDSILKAHVFTNDFLNRVKEAADRTMQGELYILFKYRQFKFSPIMPMIDWYKDFATGYRYINSHAYDCRKINNIPGVDIKNVWELSRLQYLAAPALTWKITGEIKYACFVRDVLLDWIKSNRYEEGPNWHISMETGIRAVNMLFAFELIAPCPEVSADDAKTIATSLFLHMRHILLNQENYRKKTYNHYLGGLIGVLTVGSLFIKKFSGKKIFFRAYNDFENEIKRQLLDDGGSFEGSSCYHGLVGTIFSLAALVIRNTGNMVSKTYRERLEKAIRFSLSITNNKQIAQIGDNDSGRILCILPNESLDYSFFHNAAICEVFGCVTDLFSADELITIVGERAENINPDVVNQLTFDNIIYFPQSQIACLNSGDMKCILTATDAQKYGMGEHTHNDKLSFSITYRQKEFIVDPGSGCYTSNPEVSKRFRSVTSHNTISINNKEQNIKQAQFVFGNSYETKSDIQIDANQVKGRTCVIHDTILYEHERVLFYSLNQELIINDKIITPRCSEIVSRFVLHPSVQCKVEEERAILKNGNIKIHIISPYPFVLEKGVYSPSYGSWEDTNVLCIRFKALSDITIISTVIKPNIT